MKKPSSPSYFLYTHRIWTINQTHKQEHPSNLLLSVSPSPSGEPAGAGGLLRRSTHPHPLLTKGRPPPPSSGVGDGTSREREIGDERETESDRVRSEKSAAVRRRKSRGNKTGSRRLSLPAMIRRRRRRCSESSPVNFRWFVSLVVQD
ncbi:hypothetical protein HanHA300_Chr11g0424741 [Helianthus annuus]|nr:hypothetical protein HanHA300_Chr11g0424741 [Helianthus annuus]KAJ0519440.1 hypothetical protein HanHA89_Chr11g0448771 [Helianthus annuus]